MSDEELIRRRDALAVMRKAQVASCTCLTKTPDPDWHRDGCRYRILREAEAMIKHVPPADLTAVTQPALEHVNEPPKSEHDAGNVLTPGPAVIREAALREVLDILESHGAAGEAISDEILALIQKGPEK